MGTCTGIVANICWCKNFVELPPNPLEKNFVVLNKAGSLKELICTMVEILYGQ